MIRRAHVRVIGRVQGVYFRQYTQEEATWRGVTGWVRNNLDGSVEAVFEGEEEKVKELIEWCHQGPPSALVEKVEVTWEEPTGEYPGFEISYWSRGPKRWI